MTRSQRQGFLVKGMGALPSRLRLRKGLFKVFLLCVLVLSVPLGNTAAYLALVFGLGAFLLTIDLSRFGDIVRSRFGLALIFGFACFAITQVATAQNTFDLLHCLDLAVVPLTLIVATLAAQSAHSNAIQTISKLALAGLAIAFLVAITEVQVFGRVRAEGVTSSAIYFGGIAVLLGFVALSGWFVPGKKNYWLGFAPLLAIGIAGLSGARAALLVALLLSVVFLVFGFASRQLKLNRALLAGGLALGAIGSTALLFAMVNTQRMLGTFGIIAEVVRTGASSDAATAQRLQFYYGGWRAFLDAPVFGHGWTRRFEAAAPYMSPEMAAMGDGQTQAHLHNDIISFASSGGVFGIFTYFLIVAAPILGVLDSPKDTQYYSRVFGVCVLAVGFFAMGMTDSMFVYEIPKTFYLFATSLIIFYGRDSSGAATPSKP